MFDKFQMKLQKILNKFSHSGDHIKDMYDSEITESSLGYKSARVVYYRTVDGYCIYRVIMLNEEDSISVCVQEKMCYPTLDSLVASYKERFEKVEIYNLLSVDYVYLYKSGVFVDGTDLRSRDQVLCDKIVHCLYSNDYLGEVEIHNKNLLVKLFRPYDGNYSDLNSANWSIEMIDNFLLNDRIKVFISSDTLFSFNKITKSIIVNPIELLTELECTAVSCGNMLSHCGDLGMQVC